MDASDLSPDVLVKKISTPLQWDDLVLNTKLLNSLEEIKIYLNQGKLFFKYFKFGRKLKPGFRVLFAGPSGTGKELTATLLGKQFNREVYKVNLSQVMSKYIGETEKNLSRVFDKADGENWILFFDEADAIFGKRTDVKDANDRYANQEVSFLLQRIEAYEGLVILSSNLKSKIDASFIRRCQLVVDFKIPDANQRFILWNNSKMDEFEYDKDVDLKHLSEHYELTPASIVNVLQYCILKCLERKDRVIRLEDIIVSFPKLELLNFLKLL